MTYHGWNASSSPIMSEMQWNIKFVTKFLTLQLLKMLYSDMLLIGFLLDYFLVWDQRLYEKSLFFSWNSTCMYEVLVCILMWMGIMLWCIYYFPGIQPYDLSARAGAKLFTGGCLAQAEVGSLVFTCPSRRQRWRYSKLVFYSESTVRMLLLCSFLF